VESDGMKAECVEDYVGFTFDDVRTGQLSNSNHTKTNPRQKEKEIIDFRKL